MKKRQFVFCLMVALQSAAVFAAGECDPNLSVNVYLTDGRGGSWQGEFSERGAGATLRVWRSPHDVKRIPVPAGLYESLMAICRREVHPAVDAHGRLLLGKATSLHTSPLEFVGKFNVGIDPVQNKIVQVTGPFAEQSLFYNRNRGAFQFTYVSLRILLWNTVDDQLVQTSVVPFSWERGEDPLEQPFYLDPHHSAYLKLVVLGIRGNEAVVALHWDLKTYRDYDPFPIYYIRKTLLTRIEGAAFEFDLAREVNNESPSVGPPLFGPLDMNLKAGLRGALADATRSAVVMDLVPGMPPGLGERERLAYLQRYLARRASCNVAISQ